MSCVRYYLQMQTFNVNGPKDSADALIDGVAMSQVLHQMYVVPSHVVTISFIKDSCIFYINDNLCCNIELSSSNILLYSLVRSYFTNLSVGQHCYWKFFYVLMVLNKEGCYRLFYFVSYILLFCISV